jgi:hypothetical protein
MSLGAPGQLLLQNHLAALSAGIQTSGNAAAAMGLQSPEQLQALQQALTQQHHTLQQQLQQFVLFQPGAAATGSPAQAQFFLQNQVRQSFFCLVILFKVSVCELVEAFFGAFSYIGDGFIGVFGTFRAWCRIRATPPLNLSTPIAIRITLKQCR